MTEYNRKTKYSINDNKKIKIKSLDFIHIDNFRKFKNVDLHFGSVVTILSGQNGTMKSTLIGLSIHPFKSVEVDINKKTLSTNMSEVFNWSNKKDITKYNYKLAFSDDSNNKIIEPVEVVPAPSNNPQRHRVTVSGHAKGDGQLVLPVSYLNLRRLYPQVDLFENTKWKSLQNLTDTEKKKISDFFYCVLQRNDFENFTAFDSQFGQFHKQSIGPTGNNSQYDYSSISAGEDNLSTIANQIISLERVYYSNQQNGQKHALTGILAIDEFDATLHPSSQIKLFDYLFKWAKTYSVQILLNTHSLSLISDIISQYKAHIDADRITLNFITSLKGLTIQKNPNYESAYRELTLKKLKKSQSFLKISVRLEDDVAQKAFSKIVPSVLKNFLVCSSNLSNQKKGSSHIELAKIAKSFPLLFTDSNSLIVFDADVPDSEISNLSRSKFKDFIKMPSLFVNDKGEGLPTEKEVIKWILSLEKNDIIFDKIDKYQQELISDLTAYQILSNSKDYQSLSVIPFKNWYNKNTQLFWKMFTQYKNRNPDLMDEFNSALSDKMKALYSKNGIKNIF